jgi:hypothetical protein
MEIKELVSFYVNEVSETLEVSFRLVGDNDDEVREDQIDLTEVEAFGYNLNSKIDLDLFEDDDDEYGDSSDYDLIDDFEDEDEVISFLNEYYLIYPDYLPDPELF